MNGNSKRDCFDKFLDRIIATGLAEAAINAPDSAAWLKSNRMFISIHSRSQVDKYRFLEVADIMNWKDRKEQK